MDTTQFNNIVTISPTTVLTVRYGFNRFPNYGYQVSQGFNLASLGFRPALCGRGSLADVPQHHDDLAVQPGDEQQLLLRAPLQELLDRAREVSRASTI